MDEFDTQEETGLAKPEPRTMDRSMSMSERILDILHATERIAEFQRQIIETAVKMTTPNDWVNQGGKPYLLEAGATRVASMLPIKIEMLSPPTKQWEQDEQGNYYIYTCTASAAWKTGLGSSEAIGTCSSRDKFFSMRQGVRLPQSEVDETNIIKKCGTNGRANAIKGLLGLKNMTWTELNHVAGITPEKCQSVDYQTSRKQDESPEQAATYRQELGNMILEMCHDNIEEAQNYLQAVTTFKGRDGKQVRGKRSVKDLSEKQAEITHGKVKKQYEKWRASQKAEHDDNTEKPDTNGQEDLV